MKTIYQRMKKWWPFLLSSYHHHRRLQDPIGDTTQMLTFYFSISFSILLDNIRLFAPKKRKLYCRLCAEDGRCSLLSRGSVNEWNNARKDRSNPLMLFDVESPVLLVSKVYKCEHGHDIPAGYFHDTSDVYTCVPFVLTHRSGMTMRLSNEIEDLLDKGLAISAVEELIKERYKRTLRNRFSQISK